MTFDLHTDDLAFVGRDMRTATEPGCFHLRIGSDSTATPCSTFQVVQPWAVHPPSLAVRAGGPASCALDGRATGTLIPARCSGPGKGGA